MQPYLIRPRIEADESIHGHLLRCAKANCVSPERMAHSLGLVHHYQLKPAHHQTLSPVDITQAFESRFRIEAGIILNKLIKPKFNLANNLQWHGLLFNAEDLRTSPRVCPVCISINPYLIREQWYLEPYQMCHKHLCDMTVRQTNHSQSCLPFHKDLLTEISYSLDSIFTGTRLVPNTITHAQGLLDELPANSPWEVGREFIRPVFPSSVKQLKLFST